MKLFAEQDALDAIAYALDGGQALHLMTAANWAGPTPAMFRRYPEWAHLMDEDKERLIATAKRLGVHKIVIGDPGRPGHQHVDLCGGPLARAKREATNAPKGES